MIVPSRAAGPWLAGPHPNTIVMYSTDNGAVVFGWPDGGTTPFRGEKNENWEGGENRPYLPPGAGAANRRAVHGTLKEYPPSQKVGSFSLDQVLEKLQQSGSSGK